jgi:MurNAc alpha-1-phosphate uridylyltransferase
MIPIRFKAMILAAGRGERMRPLTDVLPKPLLRAGGKALIEYHLENLARAGFAEIIVNHAHLGHLIEAALDNGERYGVNIRYSPEPVALETAGGITRALPIIAGQSLGDTGERPFLVINADIYCEMDFSTLVPKLEQMNASPDGDLAHLVLVDNPAHHPGGDFALDRGGRIVLSGKNMLTFSGIGIYHPKLFEGIVAGSVAKLAPLLGQAIDLGKAGGQHYRGTWADIGTPERLRQIDLELSTAGAPADSPAASS